MMNMANVLTMSRFVFALIISWLLLHNSFVGHVLAAVFFMLAVLTDLYDGLVARRLKIVSNFGKIMDPIADKVLLLSVFTVLAMLGLFPVWMVVVIAFREVLVTADRLKAMQIGLVLAAEQAGKIKTALQMASVGIMLVYLIIEQSPWGTGWFYQAQRPWLGIINLLMMATVAVTLVSGLAYFRSKRKN